MNAFQINDTSISGLKAIVPFYAADHRGWFMKSCERNIFAENGITFSPFEGFYTHSQKGVLRGLHFQRHHSQDKLVHVLHGAAFDVAVDLRKESETFGKWEGFYLTSENRQMLYIPKGFAHGFLALEDDTLFSYLCGDQYDPESDGGVRWDDPQLAVKWPLERVEQVLLSDKDAQLPLLADFIEQYGALSKEEHA